MLEQALDIVGGITWLTIVLGFAGFLVAVYLMSLMGHAKEDARDPIWIQWSRRFSYSLVAFGNIWSVLYEFEKGWHPWPPEMLLMLGLIIMMSLKIIVIHMRLAREQRAKPRNVGSSSAWPSSSR